MAAAASRRTGKAMVSATIEAPTSTTRFNTRARRPSGPVETSRVVIPMSSRCTRPSAPISRMKSDSTSPLTPEPLSTMRPGDPPIWRAADDHLVHVADVAREQVEQLRVIDRRLQATFRSVDAIGVRQVDRRSAVVDHQNIERARAPQTPGEFG